MVNNSWFEDKKFLSFVAFEWDKLKAEGRGDFILKEKLRLLKTSLRRWNKEVFGRIDLNIREGSTLSTKLMRFWLRLRMMK